MSERRLPLRGYPLLLYREPEDGSWTAEVPDLPGCVAAADSPEGAVSEARDAIAAWLGAAKDDGRAIPPPSRWVYGKAVLGPFEGKRDTR